jgi:hypothetical protein
MAATTGALLARQPDGTETVHFDPGAGAPLAVATAPVLAGSSPAVASPAATPAAPAVGLATEHPPRLTGSHDAVASDELYESLMTRLRRDLLAERERVGDLGPRL